MGKILGVLLLVLCASGTVARAQDQLGSDQNAYGPDVRIVSATLSGDRYETVTGRGLMDGTLAATATLFSDVDGLPGWIDNLVAAREIGAHTLTDRTVYMRFSAPAGFADRDGVMRFVASKEAAGILTLTFQDIATVPPTSDAVRMKEVRGRFRVEQVSPGKLAVEFRLHYDSHAKPLTLANLNVRRQVRQTLLRMRQQIEGPLQGAGIDHALAQSLDVE